MTETKMRQNILRVTQNAILQDEFLTEFMTGAPAPVTLTCVRADGTLIERTISNLAQYIINIGGGNAGELPSNLARLDESQEWDGVQVAKAFVNNAAEIDFSKSQIINVDGNGLSGTITAVNMTENQIGSIRFKNMTGFDSISKTFIGDKLPAYQDELQVIGYEVILIDGTLQIILGNF